MRFRFRREFLGLSVMCMAGSAIVAVACSSSDSDDGGAQNDSAAPPAESATGTDAPSSPGDAGASDAPHDAVADVIDPDVCSSRPPCDCDVDGYLRAGCVDAAQSPDADSIIDCDDHDPLKHPGQGFSIAPGDSNCSGEVETAVAPNLHCQLIGPAECMPAQGFLDQPDCGVTDTVYQCQLQAINNCQPVPLKAETQLCK